MRTAYFDTQRVGSACISFKISPDEGGHLRTAYYDTERASLHIDTIEWSKGANAFVPSLCVFIVILVYW